MGNTIKGFKVNGATIKYDFNALENAPNVQPDKTLSISDRPADAKTVGDRITQLTAAVGTPLKASTVAGMTNTDKIYVYTGSETGYTNGNWYYYDGTQNSWVSGGVYNSVAIDTDDTLSITGKPADAKKTGDEITGLKSAFNNAIESETVVKTADKTSDLFTQYGTSGYLSYTDGHFVSSDTNAVYLIDITKNNSVYFTSTSGQVGAVLFDEHLDTIPTGSSAAAAHYIKGGRSDKTGVNAIPTDESPWEVQTGQMLAIWIQTTPSGNFILFYHGEQKYLSNEVLLNDSQIDQLKEKKPTIKYLSVVDTDIGSRGKEQISIWLPTNKGYIKYAFVRCEYDTYNSNVWRIDRCYACGDDKEVLFPITNKGEWEMAIQIVNAPNFIGGNAHGNEVFTTFHVLIDGVEVDDITGITEQEFNTVNIIETSLMYNPSDEATLSTRTRFTPVGTHGREYVITKDGIRLKQFVILDIALLLTASYMTMLPILRGNDTASSLQVTDHYYSDKDFIKYDVSVGESGGAGYGWRRNVTKATIWGETSGVSATVEMLKQPQIENSGARQFQVQNTLNEYNKFYWSICGVGGANYSASANERFETDTMYKISVKDIG